MRPRRYRSLSEWAEEVETLLAAIEGKPQNERAGEVDSQPAQDDEAHEHPTTDPAV